MGHIESFSKVWMDNMTNNKSRWTDFKGNDLSSLHDFLPDEPTRRNNSASSTKSAQIIHDWNKNERAFVSPNSAIQIAKKQQ